MDRSTWNKWAQTLQRTHMKGITLAILEGAGPLKLVIAQILLAGMPFIDQKGNGQWRAAAEMLEDSKVSAEFASFLREEKTD